MSNIDYMFENTNDANGFFRAYGAYLSELLSSIDPKTIKDATDCFLEARQSGNTIFFAGNGGSASTASHFAQDLGEVNRKAGGEPFRTLSLTDNNSILTAVANDYGYEKVFLTQLKNLFKSGDVLVAISASGNSQNVIEASQYVKEKCGKVIALVGFDGGALAEMADHVIHAKTAKGEYGPVEDVHMVMDHMITSYLILHLRKNGN